MSNSARHFYEFDRFRIDASNRLVLRGGEPLPLAPKAVDTLLVLVRHGGEVLKKEELMSLVWPDTVVEEGNLTQNIYLLRKTLGQGPNGRNYIETMPRRGYRFTGEVRETMDGELSDLTLAEREKVHETIEAERSNEEGNRVAKEAVQESAAKGSKVSLRKLRAYASTSKLLLAACLLFAGLALYYLALSNRSKTVDAARPAIQSIAVLPFKPLNAASGEEDLGVGLSDALITQLSNVRRIVVRPTSAVLKYGPADQDPIAAGRELNVDAVVDGKYQRADGRLRVTVQLISVRDGTPLWAGKFDEPLTGMLSVQDAIAGRVTDALALKLTAEEQKLLTKRFTENPDAYQAYLKGRYYWSRRATPALEESIKYFEEALRDDPEDALAYAGLADAYVSLAARYDSDERSQSDAFPKAKAAALRALKLNDLLAEAHTSLAVVRERYEWDWAGAEGEYRRAIELNPNYAHAHQVYSLYLSTMGRAAEAMNEMKRAQELDPLSFSINRGIGDILWREHQYDRALEQYRRTLRMSPDDPMASLLHRTVGWVYEFRGMHDEAVVEFIEALRIQNTEPELLEALREAYDSSGMKGYWRKWLELQQERIGQGRVSPFNIAQVYSYLGDKNQAFAYLQKACDDHSMALPALRFGPLFDTLRDDSRYSALLRRMGLTS